MLVSVQLNDSAPSDKENSLVNYKEDVTEGISTLLGRFSCYLSFQSHTSFLGAFSHLYKRVCPSVRRSVRPSVRRFVRPSHTS